MNRAHPPSTGATATRTGGGGGEAESRGLRRGRRALAVATGFMALQAVYGAWLLAAGGQGLPAPPDFLPGDGWWPGAVALLVCVGAPMLVACVLQARRSPVADLVTVAAGLILVLWIVVQVALIGLVWFLQPLCFVVGLLLAGAGWWHLRVSRRPLPE